MPRRKKFKGTAGTGARRGAGASGGTATKQVRHRHSTQRPVYTARSGHDTAFTTADWLATQTLRTVNDALTGLEKGADYTLKTIQQLGNGNAWMRHWSGWATQFNPQQIMSLAQSQAASWERDINRLTRNFVRTVRKTSRTFVPQGEMMMRDARRNISQVYHRVEQSPLMHIAKSVAHSGKQEIFSFLDIPSHDEIEELQRKITTLEQRLTTVMLRGARNR